jgi:hypothetical protein
MGFGVALFLNKVARGWFNRPSIEPKCLEAISMIAPAYG